MHANVYSFWGQVEPRTEPSQQQRWREKKKKKSRAQREREKEGREGGRITAPVSAYSLCRGPTQLRHECVLNQHDSGGKGKNRKTKRKLQTVIKIGALNALMGALI